MQTQVQQFRHFDTKRRDGSYVTFERLLPFDDNTTPSDFDCYSEEQVKAWRNAEWHFIGVIARAHIEVVRNGHGTIYTIDSPGIWGVESDSGDHLDELYREQREELLADLIEMAKFEVVGK